MSKRLCKNCQEELGADVHFNTKHCNKACKDSYFYKQKRDRLPTYSMFHHAKSRATKLGLEFTIEMEDLAVPAVCPVLGIPLEFNTGGDRASHNSPSLDKMKPDAGYVKGNIRVISQRANWIKGDASIEELEKVLEYVKQIG